MGRIEIISASAGSGKTHRLATVLETAVAAREAHADAVLATTFTNKAAAELKERVRARLLAAGRTDDAHRLTAARIGTVNAVCGRLVRDFAFELGLSPDLRVLDEEAAKATLQRALSRVVRDQDAAELAEIGERLHQDWSWQDDVVNLVTLARSNRVRAEALDECARRSLQGFVQLLGPQDAGGVALDTALANGIDQLIDETRDGRDTTKKTQTALAEANRVLQRLRRSLPVRWSDWLKLGALEVAVKSRPSAEPLLLAAAAHDRHPRLHHDVRRAIELVFVIAARAMHAYDEHKRVFGALDFTDQEVLALELLERPAIQTRLAGEIDLVLVDEFQDTSPLQLAIFLRLAALAKRSVWVGDQKQAIFGFRGTDPAMMDAAVEAIVGDGEPETLETSWRSRPELVRLTSDLFAAGFARHGIPERRVRLTTATDHEPAGLGPVVERWRFATKNKEDDAAALAAAVKDFLDDASVGVRERESGCVRRVRPGDVAVLCIANETCARLARALAALGLRAVLPRRGLMATPEALLVLAGLRLFVDPGDSLAAAELARLVEFPADGDAWLDALLKRRQGAASGESGVRARVAEAREAWPYAGALMAFDAVCEAVEARQRCLEWGASSERLANLDTLRAHALDYTEISAARGAGATAAGLVAAFLDLAAQDLDGQAVVAREDAVVVSTWHSAKGLEWPVTVLFDLDAQRRASALGVHVVSDRPKLDLNDPLAGRWIRFWPQPYDPKQKKASFHGRLAAAAASTIAGEAEERQALRLLYVGWTRARDRVVLAGRTGRLESGTLALLRDASGPLIGEPSGQTLWAGRQVDVRVRENAPAAAVVAPLAPGSGYRARGARQFPPATVAPSQAEGRGEVGEPERIGGALELRGDPDMALLGEAVHGFLAADRPGLGDEVRHEIALGLLARWGVGDALAPGDLLRAGEALRRWAEGRWPGAVWRREWPLLQRRANGTIVRGNPDLVIEHEAGLVIVEHKSFPGTAAEAAERAVRFAGQIGAYAEAVAVLGGRPVVACFVHLPVSGLVVPVTPHA